MWDVVWSWDGWHWIVVGVALVVLGLILADGVVGWLGVSAVFVGLIALVFPLPLQAQFAVYAFLALVLVYVARRILVLREIRGDPLRLNDRSRRLRGHVYPLSEPIINGVGRIRVDDFTWGVAGPDQPAGTLVQVTGHDGTLLTVKPPQD